MKTKSETYQHVYKVDKHRYILNKNKVGTDLKWLARVRRKDPNSCYKFNMISKLFDKERDAALAVDKFLISINQPPVNILKKVEK